MLRTPGGLKVASALLVAGLLSACSSTSPGEERVATIPPTDGNQAAILADGRITFAEYEAALMAAIGCARAEGVSIDDPQISADGVTLGYGVADPVGGPGINEFDACYEDLAMEVDLEFQTSPETEAARVAFTNVIIDCVYGDEATDWDPETRTRTAMFDARNEPEFADCEATAADPRQIVATVE